MNTLQRAVIVLGLIGATYVVFHAPWRYHLRIGELDADRFAGYYPLWRPPEPGDLTKLNKMFSIEEFPYAEQSHFSTSLESQKFIIMEGVVVLFTAGLCILFSSSRGKDKTKLRIAE